jgi:hypothetical protein
MVLTKYYSSEKIYEEVLIYKLVPRQCSNCIPYEGQNKLSRFRCCANVCDFARATRSLLTTEKY